MQITNVDLESTNVKQLPKMSKYLLLLEMDKLTPKLDLSFLASLGTLNGQMCPLIQNAFYVFFDQTKDNFYISIFMSDWKPLTDFA